MEISPRKIKWAAAIAAAVLLLSGPRSLAADPTTELNALIAKINTDTTTGGKLTESELADDIKQFDVLLAEHKGEKTEAVAEILYMKAVLYDQILTNHAKAQVLFNQLKTEFKGTPIVAEYERREAAEKIQATLVVGAKFPNFKAKDVEGRPLSISGRKSKLLLVDFWATWCMPCRLEMPNVIAAYQKYHAQGLNIIGVSLDQDKTNMLNYIKEQNMPWPQYFDGMGWTNKLALQYGIEEIPASYLLDGNGKIIARDLRGDALDQAVAAALAKK